MKKYALSINYGYNLSARERFEKVANVGFDGISLWWGREYKNFGVSRLQQFELAKEYSLPINYVHAPFSFHTYIGDIQLQAKGIARHKDWINTCVKYEVPQLVIHVNRLPDVPYVNACLIDSIGELSEYADMRGVALAIENIGNPYDLVGLFEACPKAKFCYDTSHANLKGDNDGDLVRLLGHRLSCLHLSDNLGDVDSHWILGDGTFNFDSLATTLDNVEYKGYINAEVVGDTRWANPDEFLLALRARLEKYFG